MANRRNTFLLKRSNVAGKKPSAGDLLLGELAVNTADGILYTSGTTANSILPIGWDRVARTGDTMTGNLFTPYLSATTISATTYLNLPTTSGAYLPLSGGTVTGGTSFTNGLTASTMSATTYYGDGSNLTGISALATEFVVNCRNQSGSDMYRGQVVYMNGSTGNKPTILLAQANSEATSSRTFGVLKNDIANNGDGDVVTIGSITNLDTRTTATHPFTIDTLVDGQTIYLSPTNAGYITNVKPYAPNHLVYVGKVVRTSPTAGYIEYQIQNGYELDELHDVKITGATYGDILSYSAYNGSNVWVNSKTLNGSYTMTGLTVNGNTSVTNGLVRIQGNSANELVRITQLGSGDAFLVEDSTNPDVTPFVINASGDTGIGTLTPLTKLHISGSTPNLALIDRGSNGNAHMQYRNSAGSIWTGINPLGNFGVGSTNDLTNASLIVLASSGYVGIGTPTPSTNLHVTGSTLIGGTLSATTISATTYLNLPTDIRVTGGTYSNTTGNAIFINNTGGTFTVTGFTTGFTASNYVSQGRLSVDQTIPNSSDTLISFIDDYDPQNWWDPTSKRFTPNIAGYYIIDAGVWMESSTGTTGQANLQARVNGNTFAIVQNPNNNQTGQSFAFTKLIYLNGSSDYIDFTFYQNTGVARNILYGTAQGSGTWFSAALLAGGTATGGGGSSSFTGGTITGPTNFTAGLTANTISTTTISATTYIGLPTDVRVTGGTYATGTAIFTNNTGGTFSVTGFSTSTATAFTGGTVTGATIFTGGLSANTISATTYYNLPTDVRVTGATYSNNTFTFTNNTGGTFNTLFNTVTGLTVNGNITVTGNTYLQSMSGTSATLSGSGQNILTVTGSGNSTTSPIFSIVGSQGELFSVTDSLTGSLFSVSDISGLPIVEVFSDNTILMGSYQAPSLNTTKRVVLTAGTNTVYSIPTSAYTGAFFDYTVISSGATGARAGTIMSIWSGTTAQSTDVSTNDIGTTAGITFSVVVVGSNAVLSSSATTTGWTLKTIIRSI